WPAFWQARGQFLSARLSRRGTPLQSRQDLPWRNADDVCGYAIAVRHPPAGALRSRLPADRELERRIHGARAVGIMGARPHRRAQDHAQSRLRAMPRDGRRRARPARQRHLQSGFGKRRRGSARKGARQGRLAPLTSPYAGRSASCIGTTTGGASRTLFVASPHPPRFACRPPRVGGGKIKAAPQEARTMPKFEGFPKDFYAFFRELKQHNEREWFEDNKQRFRDHVQMPMSAFIEAMAPELKKISKH